MGKVDKPRSGSMQFWPRKRAKRSYARIRTYPVISEPQPVGIAGYKVGMTHVTFTDNRKTSLTKGDAVTWPVTVIEIPPVKIIGVRFYKKGYNGLQAVTEVKEDKLDKNVGRKIVLSKKKGKKIDQIKVEDYEDLRLILATQPSLTGIGKKKADIFEMGLGGNVEEKLNYAKENLGKTIEAKDLFKEGELIDSHSITKGKGYSGPVKRFGISLKASKSEKGRRRPGSLGGWKGQAHFMYRNAYAGKMGFHQRTEYNKLLLKIGDVPEEINVDGGYLRYGNIKNSYILVKGSIGGSSKRLIMFNKAIRPNKKLVMPVMPSLDYISTASKQGI